MCQLPRMLWLHLFFKKYLLYKRNGVCYTENDSFFHVSKILIGETKNHFDSEYIAFNSLIYKPYDACHRMSSRYISKDFPNDKKEDFGQGRMGKTENKNGHSSWGMKKRQLVRITKKAKPENRTAFRLRFMSCERCLLCCGIGREGTLFPPFLLFLFFFYIFMPWSNPCASYSFM